MKTSSATITQEFGPLSGVAQVNGVTYDGVHVWVATGDKLRALDPLTGEERRAIDASAHAGTAFDGRHLYQIAGERIQKIEPETGRVVAVIPTPEGGAAGMAWAEGRLWVGQHRRRKIVQIDPETGAVLSEVYSNRFVTGVSWVDGELWHATWEDGASELRRIDAATGDVLEALEMPEGVSVSGLESDGAESFFCGGGQSGKVRVVRRPAKAS